MQATLYGRCHQILGEETNFRDEGGASTAEGEEGGGRWRIWLREEKGEELKEKITGKEGWITNDEREAFLKTYKIQKEEGEEGRLKTWRKMYFDKEEPQRKRKEGGR